VHAKFRHPNRVYASETHLKP